MEKEKGALIMKNVQIGGTSWEVSNVALGIMRMGTLAVPKAIDAL